MNWFKKNATKILFLAAVWSFLGVSIPHVAAIFRLYDPVNDGYDFFWQGCSIAAAAGIDVLTGWLTLVMMDKVCKRWERGIIWGFIILLMAYSWYGNWLFDMLHGPAKVDAWSIVLINVPFVGRWTVAQFTPLLLSCLPLMVCGYAFMSHLLAVKEAPVVKTLAELQQEANEAEQRAEAELRIKNARKGTGLIASAKDMAKDLKQAAKEVFVEEKPNTALPSDESRQNDESEREMTEEMEPQSEYEPNTCEEDDLEETEQKPNIDPNTDELAIPTAKITQPLNSKKSPVKPYRTRSVKSTKKQRGDAYSRVKKVLLKNKDATIGQIALESGVSRGHISGLRTQILQEMRQETEQEVSPVSE